MNSLIKDKKIYVPLIAILVTCGAITITGNFVYAINAVAVGDISCSKNGNKTIDHIITSKPQLVLLLGDLAYRDDPQCFFDRTSALEQNSTILVALGNHDEKDQEMRNQILQHYNLDLKGYYAYPIAEKNNQTDLVLVMDTESPLGLGSDQYNFIKNKLENSNGYNHKIVISHKNFITCDCDHGPVIGMYDTYHDLFSEYGVDLVLSGHNHNYQRFSPIDNVTYLINGLGGKSHYPLEETDLHYEKAFDNDYGYLTLEIVNATINGKFISNDNKIRDNFSIVK